MPKPQDRLRKSLQEITTVRNITLLRENEYLSHLLSGRTKLPLDLSSDFQAGLLNDFIRGDGRSRWAFLKRLGREAKYRISGRHPDRYVPFASERSHTLESIREYMWIDRAAAITGKREQERACKKSLAIWKRFIARRKEDPYLGSLVPHQGRPGKLRVLFFVGGGGLGDAILYAPLLSAVKARLGGCEIVFMYPAKIGEQFYARSGIVDCVVGGEWSELLEAMEAAVHIDLFDLVIFSRCFIPVFHLCAKTRIFDQDTLSWVTTQREIGSSLERFSTNIGVSILDRLLNVHYLDFFGMVTGLPLKASTPIEFSPDPAVISACESLRLPARYVTVRDGANRGDLDFVEQMGQRRTTKQLSPEKWTQILSWIRSQEVKIVQVGDTQDPLLPHVDRDLRGGTSISELCFVIKGGISHIDTEGGLAHFARAVNQPSVVFFPTTSATFFGYPQNLNVSSPACGRCWYANDTWLARCPRGTSGPECVSTIELASMKSFLKERLSERRKRKQPFAVVKVRNTGHNRFRRKEVADRIAQCVNAHFGAEAKPKIAVLQAGADMPHRSLWERLAVEKRLVLCAGRPDLDRLETSGRAGTSPGVPEANAVPAYNIPLNSGSLQVAICFLKLETFAHSQLVLREIERLIGAGGLLLMVS